MVIRESEFARSMRTRQTRELAFAMVGARLDELRRELGETSRYLRRDTIDVVVYVSRWWLLALGLRHLVVWLLARRAVNATVQIAAAELRVKVRVKHG